MSIHYPKRTSKIKRRRQFGFLGRMKTKSGRALLNKRRRIGRKLNTI
jgi:large subunit ribosomal protein L34